MNLFGYILSSLIGAAVLGVVLWILGLIRFGGRTKSTGPGRTGLPQGRSVMEGASGRQVFTASGSDYLPDPPRDIATSRLVHLIFRSHALFSPDVTEWQGTAAELISRLSGSDSALLVREEWRELPSPEILGRRLQYMSRVKAHYLRVDAYGVAMGSNATIWRLSLNPEVPRAT